ncbi:DUF3052 family protein [Pseudofrankia sp. DC12]|uniref:DUF3052 family protein n=1 Tax=Pseudofrankia sp. DC12 TaxID=683315 RepID=UPI000A020DAE|nr:DUF3052 family protein [Pseudofrankia sp. DC12]
MTVTAAQAGYSGTPMVRKLGVKAGQLVVLCGAPAGWTIPDLPADVTSRRFAEPPAVEPPSAADLVVAFCRTPDEPAAAIAGFGQVVFPAGALWIAWPRRAAGHRSDVTENLIRDEALPLGLVDTKVAALDTDWSGLKLVWRKERRK